MLPCGNYQCPLYIPTRGVEKGGRIGNWGGGGGVAYERGAGGNLPPPPLFLLGEGGGANIYLSYNIACVREEISAKRTILKIPFKTPPSH